MDLVDRYGRPGKGNDKGNVEGLVGYSPRNFMVPTPRFATWDELNAYLEAQFKARSATSQFQAFAQAFTISL
jgi:transposase